MVRRIHRVDPLRPPPSSGSNERGPEANPSDEFSDLLGVLTAGKALLDRVEEYHQDPPQDPFQAFWNHLRLDLVVAEALPELEFTVSQKPGPYLERTDQLLLQNVVVRLSSILDEKLDEIICAGGVPIRNNPKLVHRIDALRDAGRIGNAPDLHSLRKLRNEIGHNVSPGKIDWPEVFLAADHVEQALVELGEIQPSPPFEVKEAQFTKLEPSGREHELGRREAILSVVVADAPYCSYRWPYVYFTDPGWTP